LQAAVSLSKAAANFPLSGEIEGAIKARTTNRGFIVIQRPQHSLTRMIGVRT
jgi:hypothetical protein